MLPIGNMWFLLKMKNNSCNRGLIIKYNTNQTVEIFNGSKVGSFSKANITKFTQKLGKIKWGEIAYTLTLIPPGGGGGKMIPGLFFAAYLLKHNRFLKLLWWLFLQFSPAHNCLTCFWYVIAVWRGDIILTQPCQGFHDFFKKISNCRAHLYVFEVQGHMTNWSRKLPHTCDLPNQGFRRSLPPQTSGNFEVLLDI